MPNYILAIDQGTTSTRALLYDDRANVVAVHGLEFRQYYPESGWVEHDANEIWETVCTTVSAVLESANVKPSDVVAVGIANQRETVVFWDRNTDNPVLPAIVWQDRRTADYCRQRAKDEPWVASRSGLVVDPYFSASKIHWALKQSSELRSRAESGGLACGTIDSWLIWRLTSGAMFATDRTNASRTSLMHLASGAWDDELCEFFDVPKACLPEIRQSCGTFGATSGLEFLPDGIPIMGVAGDQQAALFGQCGFSKGATKCTYGTGAFFLQHVGTEPCVSKNRLLCSSAATAKDRNEFVLEGSVFVAGAAVQWLRDGLRLIQQSEESEALAKQCSNDDLVFVPGLVGLGAPHWNPAARGAILGISRSTSVADFARATLDGVAQSVADLVRAAESDTESVLDTLRVDGGMARNRWFLQRQADVLGIPVVPATDAEATARGAAFLAGLGAGVWSDLEQIRNFDRADQPIDPIWSPEQRKNRAESWRKAIDAVTKFAK